MQPNLITGAEALAVRKKLKLNQSDFWRPLLVAQSCGSRYEAGREIPGPVQVLFCLRYGSAGQRRRALQELDLDEV